MNFVEIVSHVKAIDLVDSEKDLEDMKQHNLICYERGLQKRMFTLNAQKYLNWLYYQYFTYYFQQYVYYCQNYMYYYQYYSSGCFPIYYPQPPFHITMTFPMSNVNTLRGKGTRLKQSFKGPKSLKKDIVRSLPAKPPVKKTILDTETYSSVGARGVQLSRRHYGYQYYFFRCAPIFYLLPSFCLNVQFVMPTTVNRIMHRVAGKQQPVKALELPRKEVVAPPPAPLKTQQSSTPLAAKELCALVPKAGDTIGVLNSKEEEDHGNQVVPTEIISDQDDVVLEEYLREIQDIINCVNIISEYHAILIK